MVGAAEQLSPNRPIEFTHEKPQGRLSARDYGQGNLRQEPQGDETRGKGLDGRLHLDGYPPHTYPPLTHLTILYKWITRFHYVVEASF